MPDDQDFRIFSAPAPQPRVEQPDTEPGASLTIVAYSPGECEVGFYDKLNAAIVERGLTGANGKYPIDLWLNAGNAEFGSVRQTVRLLKEKATRLRVVVPGSVWGSSVLFVLAADEIVAPSWAEIRRLDVPLSREGRSLSARAILSALDSKAIRSVRSGSAVARELGLEPSEVRRSLPEELLSTDRSRTEALALIADTRAQLQAAASAARGFRPTVASDGSPKRMSSQGGVLAQLADSTGLADGAFSAREVDELGLMVVDPLRYPAWRAAQRVLVSVWRSGEPFVWLLSRAEVERLAK
ncbi:hypothetical protein KQH82_10620 [bacterium]|nr:hypothetical protein [bacterium]